MARSPLLPCLTLLVAIAGCGADDAGSEQTPDAAGASGGSGNVGGGGQGGVAGSAGSAGGGSAGMAGSGTTCGGQQCADGSLLYSGTTIPFAACCPADNPSACGVDTSIIKSLLQTWTFTCIELDQPGSDDVNCPDASPLENPNNPGEEIPLTGCCRPEGLCGIRVDLSGVPGPNFGCLEPSAFLGGTPQQCTP